MEIAQFQQRDEENINDAWERFNGLLRKCPQHGNGDEQIDTFFYNGLYSTARQYVDASAGGSIFNLGGARARDMIDTIAANSCHWPTDHGRRYRVAQVEEGGINEVLAEAMKLLMDKVDKLSTKVDMKAREKGKFPSTTEVNPREHCNAITLRSGTKYESPSMLQEEKSEANEEEQDSKEEEFIMEDEKDAGEEEVEKEKKEDPKKEVWVPKWKKAREVRKLKEVETVKLNSWGVPMTPDPPPFPGRFIRGRIDGNFSKFLEIFKKVTVNMPLLEAL
ncbi:hypothetical protein ACS0TY_006486 [Phlomoides rotata]